MPDQQIQLPTKKSDPVSVSPKRTLIYSMPKAGKTTLAAGLDNSLLLDLENGSDFVSAVTMKANSVEELGAICRQIIDQGKPYKYLIIDTVTALEAMCIPFAGKLYKNSPQGQNFNVNNNILHLPNGAGYMWLREAVELTLKGLENSCDRLILLGHLKDKFLDRPGKDSVSAKDIDLTGKLKNIVCAKADAIGYLFRRNSNESVLSFKTSEEILCGARPEHLRNQEIVVAQQHADGKITTHWDRIFID